MNVKQREIAELEDLPNIGPAMARDLRLIGIDRPEELRGTDPYRLYEKLCAVTGQRHDPCVIDVFISVVRYMQGQPKRGWWFYTAERKKRMAENASRT